MTSRIKLAYADERLAVPLAEIERRAGRRPWPWLAGVAVLATAVVAVFFLGTSDRPPSPPAGGDPAVCAQHIRMLAQVPAPEERLLLTRGDAWLRVYVVQGRVYGCRSDANTYGAPLGMGDDLAFAGGYDSVQKGGVLLGRVPRGTTRVEVRLASGEMATAGTDGLVFGAFAPGGDLAGALVTAFGRDGVLASADAPVELDAGFVGHEFELMCAQRAAAALQGDPMPPEMFRLKWGNRVLWVYADKRTVVNCSWSHEGRGVNAFRAEGDLPAELRPVASSFGDDHGSVVGRVPPGTLQVDVVLPSGQVIPAQVSGAFFGALWTEDGGEPVRYVAYTAASVVTWEKGVASSKPR